MKERPYEPSDLPSVMEIYTASIRSLAAHFYSPEQIAAWAPAPPDVARWQERLSRLHTIVAQSDGVLVGFASYTDDGYRFTDLSPKRCHPDTRRAERARAPQSQPRQSCLQTYRQLPSDEVDAPRNQNSLNATSRGEQKSGRKFFEQAIRMRRFAGQYPKRRIAK